MGVSKNHTAHAPDQDSRRAELRRYEVETDRKESEADEAAVKVHRAAAQVGILKAQMRVAQFERCLFMSMTTVGMLAAVILAFASSGHGDWPHRLSPLPGLVLYVGGSLRLHAIARREDDLEKEGSSRGG